MLKSVRMQELQLVRKVLEKLTTILAPRKGSRRKRMLVSPKNSRNKSSNVSTWTQMPPWLSTNSGKALRRVKKEWCATGRTWNCWISAAVTKSRLVISLCAPRITRTMWWRRLITTVALLIVWTLKRKTTRFYTRKRSNTSRTCMKSKGIKSKIFMKQLLRDYHLMPRSIKWTFRMARPSWQRRMRCVGMWRTLLMIPWNLLSTQISMLAMTWSPTRVAFSMTLAWVKTKMILRPKWR